MKFPFEATVKNEVETGEIATAFSRKLKTGDVVLMIGNLGTGKTYFVKSIGKAFGIDLVSSPSFSIINEYSGKMIINHFDFYRIKKVDELYDIGFSEYINDEERITIIEWAELFPSVLPKKSYRIVIEDLGGNSRKISIEKNE